MNKNTNFMEVYEEPLHKEEYKDDFIRIYRANLKPGQSTKFHRHSEDTVYFVIRGGKVLTQKMKGTPACPTILPKGVSFFKKLVLVFEKIFLKYLTLDNGFFFYMPSKKNPVIHKAVSSSRNGDDMVLLGVEILRSRSDKFTELLNYGKKEIENNAIAIYKFSLIPGKSLSGTNVDDKYFLFVVSGVMEVSNDKEKIILSEGEYYWNNGSVKNIMINNNSQIVEFIIISVKDKKNE